MSTLKLDKETRELLDLLHMLEREIIADHMKGVESRSFDFESPDWDRGKHVHQVNLSFQFAIPPSRTAFTKRLRSYLNEE